MGNLKAFAIALASTAAVIVLAFIFTQEPKPTLTVNDLSVWGYNESGYQVKALPPAIRITLQE